MTDEITLFTPMLLALAATGFALVALAMGPLRRYLINRDLLARPNERSNHTVPTPQGGGLVVIAVLLPLWWLVADRPTLHVLVPAFVLAALSWLDDKHSLSPLVRFSSHILAVAIALWVEPTLAQPLADILPRPVAVAIIAVGWVWFINLFNFMDGIDGITGAETAAIGLGVAAVVMMAGLALALGALGICAVAVACGFLLWNWHPARIFLGDVGSVPLGFLLGWLLLSLAAQGPWAAALILPAYYLSDATITLLRRLARGEKVWRAHREHFYQRPVIAGVPHSRVTLEIVACNLVLIGIAVFQAQLHPLLACAMAAVPVIILLVSLHHAGTRRNTGG